MLKESKISAYGPLSRVVNVGDRLQQPAWFWIEAIVVLCMKDGVDQTNFSFIVPLAPSSHTYTQNLIFTWYSHPLSFWNYEMLQVFFKFLLSSH